MDRTIVNKCLFSFVLALWASALSAQTHWSFDASQYQYDMRVFYEVKNGMTIDTNLDNYEVAAFVGDECRGIGEVVTPNGSSITYGYLIIKSNVSEGETVTFKIFDKTANEENEGTVTVDFEANSAIGYPSTPFTIKFGQECLIGDANGDGTVNVIDVVTTIDYILMKNPTGFAFTAADVNNDQTINVIDVVGIIDIILGKWSAAPMHRSVTDWSQDKLQLVKNDDQSLSLCLENEGQYVAAQFDLRLQSGQTLKNMKVNEDRAPDHQISYSLIEPNLYRVLLIGMGNTPIEGQHGEIVNFKIAGGVDGVKIENAQFVTVNREAVQFDNISDITTGISDIASPKLMDIYTIDGRLVRSRTATTEGLKKGVYIINNTKTIIK